MNLYITPDEIRQRLVTLALRRSGLTPLGLSPLCGVCVGRKLS